MCERMFSNKISKLINYDVGDNCFKTTLIVNDLKTILLIDKYVNIIKCF